VTPPRLTWLGHATVLVELGAARLLTDPVLRSRVIHLRRHGAAPGPQGDIDAVLLSHLHYDHLDLPSLRMLDAGSRLVCPWGAGDFLARAGLPGAEELLPGEWLEVGAVRVEATPAEHDGTRRPRGPVARPVGFVLRGERSIYFAGDTDLFEEMAELAPLDVALLPVAGWSPKLGPGHLDPQRAARAAALLRPRVAVPIHWGTLHPVTRARGAWFTDPPLEFAAQVAELAPEVDVRLLSVGESLEL
jgi:L-ascorbate metabolism protein UlaG (beta-lactamase superfamily)